jgi:hypothetical protein
VIPRSTRIKSSSIAILHPLVPIKFRSAVKVWFSHRILTKHLSALDLKNGPGRQCKNHLQMVIYIEEIEEGIKCTSTLENIL